MAAVAVIEKFHRNERLAAVFPDFVDRANIVMIQGGGGLGLALEAAKSL